MASTRLSARFIWLASLMLAACSGGGGGGGGDDVAPGPDAKVFLDAAIDAPPPMLMGLGQACGAGLPACPANAPQCVGVAGTNNKTYCTPKCLTGGTATGAANNQLSNIQPAPNNMCTTSYTGTIGMPTCALILAFTPMDNPIVANKAYTNVEMGCLIRCGAANACPPGTTAVTAMTNCLCLPQ